MIDGEKPGRNRKEQRMARALARQSGMKYTQALRVIREQALLLRCMCPSRTERLEDCTRPEGHDD